jgi:hypothetical protein
VRKTRCGGSVQVQVVLVTCLIRREAKSTLLVTDVLVRVLRIYHVGENRQSEPKAHCICCWICFGGAPRQASVPVLSSPSF